MKKASLYVAVTAAVGAALFPGVPGSSGQTDKALVETPTTVSHSPAERKKALELAPDSFRDRLNYRLALLPTSEMLRAIFELDQAQDPRSPDDWFNLGTAFKRQGHTTAAIREFERMVQPAPDMLSQRRLASQKWGNDGSGAVAWNCRWRPG